MTFTGILFLIIATVLTAMFSIVFKIFHRKDIDANQAELPESTMSVIKKSSSVIFMLI